MVSGRSAFGIGRLGGRLGLLAALALVACGGNSERRGSEDGDNGGSRSGGSGGSGGGTSGKGGSSTGGSSSGYFVATLDHSGVDKIDLLLMVDNSISMADKQALLAQAVPVLVSRLIDPICVDSSGYPTPGTASIGCSGGSSPEFPAARDIHIGVITSSLGSHGGDVCVDTTGDPTRTLNDRAELVASLRGAYSYQDGGFLVWDPRESRPAPDPHPGTSEHETDPAAFIDDLASHVVAAGERGCGFEASLEAWYRFLIDPEPVADVTADLSTGFSLRGPVNSVVLEQRARFLRPDSLLAIIMLSDENDCSIVDEDNQQGWLVGRRSPMPRASVSCSDPNDRCCRPCVVPPAAGCPDNANDPYCAQGDVLTPIEDSTNLRCYGHLKRFGIDFLYPWERYVEGLTFPRLPLRSPGPSGETEVMNPIYTPGADGTPAREPSLVFLVGIVGVPWQDVADGPSLAGPGLRYLTASEMFSPPDTDPPTPPGNRWDIILGDPDRGVLPVDPFMIETVDPRSGANPITGDMIAPPGTNAPNAINGHEANNVNRDDLQYACIFDVQPDIPCSQANQDGCDCNASDQAYDRPTCDYPNPNQDGIQTHAKAYPSVRQLQVLKGFGENAVVASICPKNTMPNGPAAEDPNYGYNPAVSAMIGRFKEVLGPRCFPRALAVDSSGQVACTMVEARAPADCSCEMPGRADLGREVAGVIRDELALRGLCGGDTGVDCDAYCLCEIQQFAGDDLDVCLNVTTDPGNMHGFCYVSSENGSDSLLAQCPPTQPQFIRFMGEDVPAQNSIAMIACGPEN